MARDFLYRHVIPAARRLRNEHDAPVLHWANLTPEFCVRQPALTS